MRLSLPLLASALLLTGTAQAEDAAKAASPSYAETIRCQAFYVVYAGLLERESAEYQVAANVFDEWYDYTAAHYPDGDGQNHDGDLQTAIARIDLELSQADGRDAAEKIMSGYFDGCAAIEPFSV